MAAGLGVAVELLLLPLLVLPAWCEGAAGPAACSVPATGMLSLACGCGGAGREDVADDDGGGEGPCGYGRCPGVDDDEEEDEDAGRPGNIEYGVCPGARRSPAAALFTFGAEEELEVE